MAAVGAIAASCALAACGGGDGATTPSSTPADTPTNAAEQGAGEPQRGGVLTFARDQEPESGLNPIGANDNGSIFAIMQIFDQLVEIDGGAEPAPGLATSWKTSADGKRWTFKLREASFSNGDPVTAEDVQFSLQRFADPKVNSSYAAMGSSIRDVEVIDDATVQVALKRPDAAFLDNIAMFVASIVPKGVVEEMGEEAFGEAPVGSGPFQVAEFRRGQDLRLERNPEYWREGEPYLDAVELRYVKDANTRVLQVRNGDVQVAAEIPYNQVAELDGAPGVNVEVAETFKWDAIWFNTTRKPLDDVKVRQALNYATPKEGILDSVLHGDADVANSVLARVKYWDENVEPYPYDLDRAKDLMAESSVPDGFQLPLVISGGDPVEKQTAEILKAEWAKIGVELDIRQEDIGTLFTNWFEGKHAAATFPGNVLSSDTLSDDNLAFVFLDPEAGLNSFATGYDNPRVTELVRKANRELDEDERRAMFSEIQRTALEDAPAVPLFFTKSRTAVRDDVQGFVTYKTGWWPLRQVWLAD